MSGRIEPTPIGTDVATLGDYRSRALLGDQQGASGDRADDGEPEEQVPSPKPARLQPVAPSWPTRQSATPFEAALAASMLDVPSPRAWQLLLQRKGNWSPPESDLHLTDRIA